MGRHRNSFRGIALFFVFLFALCPSLGLLFFTGKRFFVLLVLPSVKLVDKGEARGGAFHILVSFKANPSVALKEELGVEEGVDEAVKQINDGKPHQKDGCGLENARVHQNGKKEIKDGENAVAKSLHAQNGNVRFKGDFRDAL